jgi:hypothetical protein
MSETSDVIIAALTERVFQELGEREGDSAAALAFGMTALTAVVRARLMTVEEAVQLLHEVFAQMRPRDRTGLAAERIRQATDWLRALAPADRPDGKIIEGSARPMASKKR